MNQSQAMDASRPFPGPPNGIPNGKANANQKRGTPLNQIYTLPAPIKTFPLPTFYPNNPLSIFHLAYAWLSQKFCPPPHEPSVIHHGVWSEATTSVHVTDEKSVRALWEQGFYGKGNLSRSEPNWLKREQVRRGLEKAHVSELNTIQRREERARAKWERARLEQEAIRQTRLEEAERKAAQLAAHILPEGPGAELDTPAALAPVGPVQLLALPNSARDLPAPSPTAAESDEEPPCTIALPPVGPLELLALPNSARDLAALPSLRSQNNVDDALAAVPPSEKEQLAAQGVDIDSILGPAVSKHGLIEPSLDDREGMSSGLAPPQDASVSPETQNDKVVRFSEETESTSVETGDPKEQHAPETAGVGGTDTGTAADIVNKEHLQLTPEEAFFLSFGLGVLTITDGSSGAPLATQDLFRLFRQFSYFPPRSGPDDTDLPPDDSFLVHYAVYHHFRSLGWVPRPGIKFGVDWMLYTRGPVFDHAEFGLVVIPSYTHPGWKTRDKQKERKTWAWFHSVLRVLSHVMKSVVLVYVDVPPPDVFEGKLEEGFAEVLGQYKIREVMIKRWSSNRNRG